MEPTRPLPSPLGRPIRLVAAISGGGRTVLNLHAEIVAGRLHAELTAIFASRPDCGGIANLQALGLPVEVLARRDYPDTAAHSTAFFNAADAAAADLVILAGFLTRLEIPERYRLRVLNIHPSLIPAFAGQGYHGRHVHAAAIERGVKVSGCTVHFVDNEYDHGPILQQQTVPVLPDDTPDTLAARVFTAECVLYPQAIAAVARGRLEVRGRQVVELAE